MDRCAPRDRAGRARPLAAPRNAAALAAACALAGTSCLAGRPAPPEPIARADQPAATGDAGLAEQLIDRGSFALVYRGRVVGVERFELRARGPDRRRLVTRSHMVLGGRPWIRRDDLVVDGHWRPLHYRGTGTAAGESFAVSLTRRDDDSLVRVHQTRRGTVSAHAGPAVDLYLVGNGVAHLTGLCRAGKRPTDLIAFPDLALRVSAVADLRVADRDDDTVVAVTQLRVTIGSAEIDLFCAGPRLLLVAAPTARFAAARRELFELLESAPLPGDAVGAPTGQSPR